MFPETRDLSVIHLHEAAVLMVRSGVDALCSSQSHAFETSMKAAAPTCAYAFECLSKLAFILARYAEDGTVPSNDDIKSFADGTYWMGGQQVKSMRGHHVEAAIRGLVDNHSTEFTELDHLLQEPFNQRVLTALTAFHAFTRYAWIDDLRDDDRDIAFDATVFGLQRLHLADQPPEIREVVSLSSENHQATFLPRVGDVLTDICFALTVGLYRIVGEHGDTPLMRTFVKHLVGVFPERSGHLLGLTPQSKWGHPSEGAWGTYCFQ